MDAAVARIRLDTLRRQQRLIGPPGTIPDTKAFFEEVGSEAEWGSPYARAMFTPDACMRLIAEWYREDIGRHIALIEDVMKEKEGL